MRQALIILLSVFAVHSVAQVNLTGIATKYTAWHDEHPQLVPYMYLNQEKFVPGDTVFFKAWLMTADLRPVSGTFVMHLSLVNSAAREVVHQSVRVSNGASGNQLILPDTLRGGFYKLVLYNNWMKYYGAENFHQHEIEVLSRNRIVREEATATPVSFFAEGGRLIAGIPSKVVAITNESGEGQLVDDLGKSIINVGFDDDHIGFAVFTPEQGRTYVMTLNGQTYSLPVPATDGVGLLLAPTENRTQMRTVIAVPPGSRFMNTELQVMVTMANAVYFFQKVTLTDRNFFVMMIPEAQLPPGIANLSVFSADDELLASRNFLVTSPLRTVVKVNPAKATVAPREKIQLEISLTDESGLMVQGDLAVAAVNQKIFSNALTTPFEDAVQFSGVKLPRDVVVDRARKNWFSIADQLLIASTKSNPWLNPALQEKNPSYLNTWLYARGRVVDPATNQPLPDTARVNFYLQKHPMAYEVKTNQGYIDTYIPMDFWGEDEFFYNVMLNGNDVPARVEWVDDDPQFEPASRARTVDQPDPYVALRTQKKSIDQSYTFFKGKEPEPSELLVDLNAEIEDEIMGADITVNLDDYIQFNSMDEVIREIIPALIHRRNGNRSIVRVGLVNPNIMASGNPLYIIDGVMTMDTDFFINLDQKNVHTIKVVHDQGKLRHMGPLGRSGVVFVTSKKSVAQAARKSSKLIGITGLSKAIPFRNVKHGRGKNALPDFRATIYWNPSVKTDNTGRAVVTFEASDDVGPLTIRVAGITQDGRAFSTSTTVDVVFGNP